MYLITWNDKDCVLEASLGGRVTFEEALVVYEELQEIVGDLGGQPYLLVLDYSKAKGFDADTENVVGDIRDFCLSKGAEKVVSVVRDEDEIPLMTGWRLQNVLEGVEDFVTDPSVIEWTPMIAIGGTERLAA